MSLDLIMESYFIQKICFAEGGYGSGEMENIINVLNNTSNIPGPEKITPYNWEMVSELKGDYQ